MEGAGSALIRFERALAIGRPSIVLAAANELPRPLPLQHAIRVLLVLAAGEPERFPTAAARFGSRLITDYHLNVPEAQLALAALSTLGTSDPDTGAVALCHLLKRHDEPEAAGYVSEWLNARSA